MPGRVDVVIERWGWILSLDRKMSTTALRVNDCSLWVL